MKITEKASLLWCQKWRLWTKGLNSNDFYLRSRTKTTEKAKGREGKAQILDQRYLSDERGDTRVQQLRLHDGQFFFGSVNWSCFRIPFVLKPFKGSYRSQCIVGYCVMRSLESGFHLIATIAEILALSQRSLNTFLSDHSDHMEARLNSADNQK